MFRSFDTSGDKVQNVRKINKATRAGLHRGEIKNSYNWLEFPIASSVKQSEKLLRNISALHITRYIDKTQSRAIKPSRKAGDDCWPENSCFDKDNEQEGRYELEHYRVFLFGLYMYFLRLFFRLILQDEIKLYRMVHNS